MLVSLNCYIVEMFRTIRIVSFKYNIFSAIKNNTGKNKKKPKKKKKIHININLIIKIVI